MPLPSSDMGSPPSNDSNAPVPPALCLRCGSGRRLGLARCGACGHSPTEELDRAAHLLAMDLCDDERKGLMARVATGQRFEPDPQELEETVAALRRATPLAVGAFALVVGGGPLLLAVLALTALAWALLPL